MEIAAAGEGSRSLRKIAQKLLELAGDGDMRAIVEVADRIDGRVPQAIAGTDDDGNLTPLAAIINITGRPEPASTS
jgi:hypothetical protein